ncbi:6-phosphogluconolactonase [Alteromonas sp. KUL49]|uniref:6-phosphogluconolactonase n=1 Tax=Alteromonas sp. KUL49 TaxID=2480798 RepID=UPI00102F1519|nr:6-phosphogluconolactonase [Alteromonas sp. KUL49]TAP37392.1 6-phosphogluconolactonase [Alteromonas sp. KUL49]GEA13032.1 6-phosphogluconolactonase [Alteromonas sp. KUL49]
MALTTLSFDSADALTQAFAEDLVSILKTGIRARGRASLVVSGGRTPLPLFKQLSETDLEWDKVDVTLADERWVDEGHDASNTTLVKNNLIQNKASAATFVPLKSAHENAEDGIEEAQAGVLAMSQPFDALILGMGEDGHTASLFPCSEQVADGLDMDSGKTCLAVQPTTAPHQRISLTLPALLNSRNIFLHLTGEKKKQVLNDAIENATEIQKPIVAVVNRAPVTLMWAP